MMVGVQGAGGLWVEIARRDQGLRKFGVPPGGLWNQNHEEILSALGVPILLGEAASTGPGPVVRFWSDSGCTWLILGSKGRIVRGHEEAAVPALLAGNESATLISEMGGRWMLAAFSSSAAPLIRSLLWAGKDESQAIRITALAEHQKQLEDGEWMVSPQSSRIGLRLLGPAPELPTLSSSRPSAPGVIQASGKGELLVHGPEGPTSGGYQALGAVIRVDLHKLAESPPGSKVRLRAVCREEAMALWIADRNDLMQRAAAVAKLKRLGLV